MKTKANGELTPKEKAHRERLEAFGIKPTVRRTTRQKFLFKDTQVYATHTTIQRTRKQCMYWGKNGHHYALCSFNKKYCRPSVCTTFLERV